MSPEDIKKLLGGYATGTLTAEEQQALFAAALEDQELFDALAREQSLRDLLRDPAARAEMLSALDVPASRFGFWQWVRRPMVAGLATACVVAIAVIAVWQGTHVAPVKPAPMIVAELRNEPPSTAAPAGIPSPTAQSASHEPAKVLKSPPPARPTPSTAPPPAPQAPPPQAMQDSALRKDQVAATAPATPTFMARKAEAEAAASARSAGAASVDVQATQATVQGTVSLDARTLFYGNKLTPGANTFVPRDGALAGAGGGGAAPPTIRPAPPPEDAPTRTAKAIAGLAASITADALHLGVRVSILRGTSEADLSTALDPGETVRLKLIPNADGFLYVADGARMVASGAVQRLKPFVTPELRLEGSGQKQLYVMLARSPQTVAPESIGTLARGDLVETPAAQEPATYAVTGTREAAAPRVVVPVTLTWR
jgi:outer membrane biosynthesis protein TonB